MKKINLRDFYASLYAHDCIYEVPDEVADLLVHFKSRKQSQIRQKYKHRAHYSLDRDDGIENSALFLLHPHRKSTNAKRSAWRSTLPCKA